VLTAVAGSPFPAPGNPVMIASEASGKYVYTANQSTADVSGFAINPSTGALTPLAGSPYPSGPAPVALAIDPAGKYVYVANSAGSTISGFSIGPTGDLTPVPGSPFPADFFPRAFAIDPLGKFLYVGIASSFMGDSTEVMAFTIAPSGALNPVPGSFAAGRNPIAPAVDSSGKFLYVGNNQDSTVSGFTIDASTGALTPMGPPIPVAGVLFTTVDVSGKFLYVAGTGVSGFTINAATGALTQIPGSPFPVGSNIWSVVTVKPK
jgi:6-phosphogluconolactonase